VVDWATISMGGAIVCLIFINVVLHQVGHDLAWTTELSQLLMVWATFVGGAAATRRGEHIAIAELVDLLPARCHRWAEGITQLLAVGVLCVLIWYGISVAGAAWTNRLTVLDLPMTTEYLALPVGSALTLVFVLYDLTQIARGRSRLERYERD
jgi:TRAP-type C4-dicarboxylate transport system permease small subunit